MIVFWLPNIDRSEDPTNQTKFNSRYKEKYVDEEKTKFLNLQMNKSAIYPLKIKILSILNYIFFVINISFICNILIQVVYLIEELSNR